MEFLPLFLFFNFLIFFSRKLSDSDQQNRELIGVISKKEESLYQSQVSEIKSNRVTYENGAHADIAWCKRDIKFGENSKVYVNRRRDSPEPPLLVEYSWYTMRKHCISCHNQQLDTRAGYCDGRGTLENNNYNTTQLTVEKESSS